MWNKKAEANRMALIKEVCRNGEVRLQAQVQLAIAAHQRASELAGIYVATATAIVAAVFLADQLYKNYVWLIGAVMTSLLLFIGSLFCFNSTMPVRFRCPGEYPAEWEEDINSGKCISNVMWKYACDIDSGLKENRSVMSNEGKCFRMGACFGIFAPVIGGYSALFYFLWVHYYLQIYHTFI